MSELSSPALGPELHLDEGQRRQLGLEPGDRLRLLHAGSARVVLERTASATPIAIPWDRDLVLSAEVRSFPLADVLNVLHAAGKSGFLYFRRDDHEKSVYLHCGEVVFATSNQVVDRLGESLLRSGLITLDELRDAERSFDPPERFGKVLVQRGILTPRVLWDGVKVQIEDIVRSLFSYTSGTVHFWEGDVQPDNVVRLTLPTGLLVEEGTRRRDELLRLLAKVEDPRVRICRLDAQVGSLAANERAFLEALDFEGGFRETCHRVGLDSLSGARTLQLLSLMGAVKLEQCEADGDGARLRRHQDDVVRSCALEHLALASELVAPIVAVEGTGPLTERLAALLRELSQRHAPLLEGLTLGPGGTFDPDEVVSRALRLPGDRVRATAAAFGEVVAYLEFELRNHPAIPEPDHFLEALEGVRARLER